MRSRLFWRRSAAAAGTYASAVFGFLGTVVAAHVFTTRTFGLYAIVLAAAGFFPAQFVATAAVDVAGWVAFRRFPQHASARLGPERRDVLSFVGQSSVASAVTSLTSPLAVLVLGRVASATQVAWFRAALSPQQALAALS